MEWIKEGFGFIDNLFGKGIYVFLYFMKSIILALVHGCIVFTECFLEVVYQLIV